MAIFWVRVIFNALVVLGISSFAGVVKLDPSLLRFSLPVLIVSSLFFYLLTQDKKVSKWEGLFFIVLWKIAEEFSGHQ